MSSFSREKTNIKETNSKIRELTTQNKDWSKDLGIRVRTLFNFFVGLNKNIFHIQCEKFFLIYSDLICLLKFVFTANVTAYLVKRCM